MSFFFLFILLAQVKLHIFFSCFFHIIFSHFSFYSQQLLAEVSSFEETNLSHVKTLEPMTGEELAKTEIHRSHTLERVTSFDKTTLKATITEEKVILPDTDTLSMV